MTPAERVLSVALIPMCAAILVTSIAIVAVHVAVLTVVGK